MYTLLTTDVPFVNQQQVNVELIIKKLLRDNDIHLERDVIENL